MSMRLVGLHQADVAPTHLAAVPTAYLVMLGMLEAAEKAFLVGPLKVFMSLADVGLPVPARGRTKPPFLGAHCGVGIGTLALGEVKAPWGCGC